MTEHEKRMRVQKAVKKVLSNPLKSKKAVMAKFTKTKDVDFPINEELFERLLNLIHEYDGKISVAAVLGILDILKDDLLEDRSKD